MGHAGRRLSADWTSSAAHLGITLAVAGTLGVVVDSQTAPSGRASFDVVSIRPVVTGRGPLIFPAMPATIRLTPGRVHLGMTTARGAIMTAYGAKDRQLLGGPSWITSDRFDIDAKSSEDVPVATLARQLPELLRGVLQDRFLLRVHMERRRLPAYAFVRAHEDRHLGPGLRPSTLDCEAVNRERFVAVQERRAPSVDSATCSSRTGPGLLVAEGITMTSLADMLPTGAVERVVVDRTDLSGTFDVELRWASSGFRAGPPEPSASLFAGPSLFTAIQEQLGLKLEARDEWIDVIVIDQIERPTPN